MCETPPSKPLREIRGKPGEKLFPVFRPLGTRLLELDDMAADEPVGRRHGSIHHSRGQVPGLGSPLR